MFKPDFRLHFTYFFAFPQTGIFGILVAFILCLNCRHGVMRVSWYLIMLSLAWTSLYRISFGFVYTWTSDSISISLFVFMIHLSLSLFPHLPSLELYVGFDTFAECFVCSQLVFLCYRVFDLCDGNSKAMSKYALVKCIQFFFAWIRSRMSILNYVLWNECICVQLYLIDTKCIAKGLLFQINTSHTPFKGCVDCRLIEKNKEYSNYWESIARSHVLF